MSRDEMSRRVVSYADVRRCIAGCYEELRARASGQYPQPLGPGGQQGQGQQQMGMPRSRSRASMQHQQY